MLLPPGGDSWYVPLRGQHPEARGHLSEALTEDTGVGNSVAGSPLPLTTGNENLDVAIVIHLQYCNHLVQVGVILTSHNVSFKRFNVAGSISTIQKKPHTFGLTCR